MLRPVAGDSSPLLLRRMVAERLGIPTLQPERLAPGLDLGASTVVVVAYGLIVPEALLGERLWLNVHPSLLPRWRGAAPVERAIMAGDVETGVTIIRLAKDSTPARSQHSGRSPSRPTMTPAPCTRRRPVSRSISSTSCSRIPAPEFRAQRGEATYAEKISAADRLLDLSRAPDEPRERRAGTLAAHRRACGAHGRRLTIWRARIGDDGSFAPVDVQPDGGRRMSYDAWLRGLRR